MTREGAPLERMRPNSRPWGLQGDEAELVVFPPKMGGQDGHTEDGRPASGHHCPQDPHAQGEDEYPVQHHIGQASHDHGGHGQLRGAVVADKAQQDSCS